jgi:hypothetical protein
MQRAVNPQTGEVLFLVNNQWVPPSQTARNPKTGQFAYLVNNEWQIADPFKKEEKEEDQGFLGRFLEAAKPEPFTREVLDIPLKVAQGTVGTTRAISDAFGANNAFSQNVKGVEDYLARLASAQSQQDSAEIGRIMKEAEDKGVGDQLRAALQAFTVAPLDFLSQAAGSTVPILLGAVAGLPGILTTAGLTGAGVVKGTIYDTVKEELKAAGVPEKDAEERAQLAQEYGGENLDMILGGTVLGVIAGRTGVERYILGKIAAKQAAQQVAQKGAVRQAVETGVTEAIPEAIQAGQEQLAANIAAQREGLDIPTFRGVAGQAALEAIAGGTLGAGVGAVGGIETTPAAAAAAPTAAAPTTPPAGPSPVTPVTPSAGILGGYTNPADQTETRIIPAPNGQFQVLMIDTATGQTQDGGTFGTFDEANNIAAQIAGVAPTVTNVTVPPAVTPPVTPTGVSVTPSTPPTPPTPPAGTVTPPTPPTGTPGGTPPTGTTPPTTIKPPEFTPEEQEAVKNYFVGEIPNADTIFQNRDRSGKGSVAQMQKIAAAPDYSLVGPSKVLAEGAPVVISDIDIPNKRLLGRMDTATASNGQRFPVQYAVIPAADLVASNTADGSVNPLYGNMTTPGIRVVAGNGRVAGIQEAYRRKTAGQYATEMMNDPSHGIDFQEILNVLDPVLVRIMPKSLVPANIGDLSNVSGIAGLEPIDRAKNDLKRLSGKFDITGLQFTEEGMPQLSTIKQFIQAMPDSEQSELINKSTGLPTPEASARLMNAIFYGAYENDALIDLYAATTNPDAKMYLNSLAKVAPKMVKLTGTGDYDIRPKIVEAIENMVSAIRQGVPIKEMPTFVQQGAIGLDPYAQKVMEFIAESGRSSKRIAEGLSRLADSALAASQVSQEPDMFGQVPPRPTLDNVFESLRGVESEPDLFGQPPPPPPPTPPKVAPTPPKPPEEVKFTIDKTAPEIYQDIKKLDLPGLSQWAIDNAPNDIAKEIATKIKNRIDFFASRNIELNGPIILNNSQRVKSYAGLVHTHASKLGVEITYKLNGLVDGKTASSQNGLKYETILHELVHAATTVQTMGLPRTDPLISELEELRRELRLKFKKDLTAKKFNELQDSKKIHAIRYALQDIDELMAKGLTDPDAQKYFKDIQVSKNFTAFGKLVDIARRVLGLPKNTTSGLEALLSVTDKLLSKSASDLDIDLAGKVLLQRRLKLSKDVKDTTQERSFLNITTNVFGQPLPKNAWVTPIDSKMDNIIYTLQDKLIDTKRVVENIRKSGKQIADRWDPYLQEELFHGRTAKQTQDFLKDELEPLINEIRAKGLTIEQLEEYLHNRHAESRNKFNAKRDPNMPDGGSGIMTADAQAYMAALTPQQKKDFDDLAKRVDAIVKGTQDVIVKTGQETQAVINAWNNAMEHYVPLQREEADYDIPKVGTGVGSGIAVKGPFSRAALGSSRNVVNILANLGAQRERAIVRGEKMRVQKALYGLVASNPNPGFWLAFDPEAMKDPVKVQAELSALGLNPNDIQNLIAEPVKRTLDPRTNTVVETPADLLKDSRFSVPIRINGKEKYVIFNSKDPRAMRMAEALQNLDVDSLGRVLAGVQQFTQYFAKINTQYNPIFGVINFVRDVQGAMIQVGTTPLAKNKTEIVANTLPALRGIYAEERNRRAGKPPLKNTWAQLWEEFQQEGGQTGFRDQFSRMQDRAEALQAILDPSSWTKTPLGKVFTAGGTLKVPMETARKVAAPLFNWLSDYNQSMENAIRLAAYKAALDKEDAQGNKVFTKQQAASLAKNLTVNFNRKGQIGRQAGAWFAFFNAAVQGTARMAQTMFRFNGKRYELSPLGKKIFWGGLLIGSAQAMALAALGFDEDEPPEFIKERNFIIPTGKDTYLMIPMPLGYNVIPNTGRILTEWTLSGFKETPKRVEALLGSFLDMFNPLGNAGWSAQTFMPTVFDPATAIFENKDWTGKPIAKEDFNSLSPTPGYTRAKETASALSKELAYFLNAASGGTDYKPGRVSPTPDQIDYLIGQLTGGVGRELLKVEQTVTSQFTGEELPIYKVPLVGRFAGETTGVAAERNRFYSNLIELNKHENELKGRRKDRVPTQDYLMEYPEARLYGYANQVERNIQKLKKRRDMLIEKDAPKEQVKAVENQMMVQMKRFNDKVREVQQ